MESPCHERVILWGVAEHHQFRAADTVAVSGQLAGLFDDLPHQLAGVQIDPRFGRADVDRRADMIGNTQRAGDRLDQFDDYLFCLRSLKNISPLLKLIIAELSTFIHDKKDRLIFTEITSGAKIEDVAKRCGISYDGICRRYKVISLRLQENMGFLTEYKKTITNQDLEIERLWIENRNMEYELRRLYKKALQNGLCIESPRSLTPVPLNAAKRICQPITRLTLAPYIRKCLTTLKIETIEDILRYALKNGLDSLLDLPGFGALGLAQLKFQLEKHKIIDKTGHSDLYQYIICEADN